MNFEEISFLWKEEHDILKMEALKVPDNGCIVEIGTALGGSAGIICDTIQNKNISFYTVDKNPSETAKKNLEGKPVNLIHSDSVTYAKEWQKTKKEPIDLLIIDGDHSFEGIYNDFFGWLPNITENTTLMFHDYDPDSRGGIAHFAVHIFLKSLINNGLLVNTEHLYRYLICNANLKVLENNKKNSIEIYINTLTKINVLIYKHIKEIHGMQLESALAYLSTKQDDLDSVSACFIIYYLLQNNFEKLYIISKSGADFLFWAEAATTFKMAFGESCLLTIPVEIGTNITITGLSKIIAKEQILFIFLKNLLKNFVEWIP
ncbi:MAG: class I SAM-dependent methyltransferase [FCB group bacterium]|jgi:hypothetical protein